MGVNNRWRYQPFTGVTNQILITDEEHTIEYFAEPNAYGFYANEGVLLESPSSAVLVQDNTAQTPFTEQPRTIAPGALQFRIDYDAIDYYNTGFVQCNAADNGKAVLFTYYGTGTIVHPSFRLNTDFNLPGNANVEGNLDVGGALDVVGAVTTNGFDLTKKFTSLTEVTASGNWVCPAGVTQIFAEVAAAGGGGGGGQVNGGGGGGGAGEIRVAFVTVTPATSYPLTVGAGGAGGAAETTGSAGGDSTGFSLTSKGGAGGIGGASNSGKRGGAAGTGGTGGTLISAQPGAGGVYSDAAATSSVGGNGGGVFGGLGGAGTAGGAGGLASGGGGGQDNPNAGGNGGGGYVRIYY